METTHGAVFCEDGVWQVPPLYCVDDGQGWTVAATDVLTFTVTIATESGNRSVLDVEWAWSVEEELRQALATTVGVLKEQVHILDIRITTGSSLHRRLTEGSGGLAIDFLIDTYSALDDADEVSSNIVAVLTRPNLGPSTAPVFVAMIQRLLGEEAPLELRTASVSVSVPQEADVEVPQAAWRAVTEWSGCSDLCGVGVSTRQVECSIGSKVLCNANSPAYHIPGDASSYYPDIQECRQYTECGFNILCPLGPDPDTGEGCIVQGAVFGGLYAAFLLLLAAESGVYCRRMCRKPRQGVATLNWSVRSMGRRSHRCANWRLSAQSERSGKEHILWDVDVNVFNQLVDPELGDNPQSWSSAPVDPADLCLGHSYASYRLTAVIRTTWPDGFIMGKIFTGSSTSSNCNGEGDEKIIALRDGKVTFQFGNHLLQGSTVVSDGQQHEVGIEYLAEEDMYAIRVDNCEEARGIFAVEDHPKATWRVGKPIHPKSSRIVREPDDTMTLQDSPAFGISPPSNSSSPHFIGSIEDVIFHRKLVNLATGTFQWRPRPVRAGVHSGCLSREEANDIPLTLSASEHRPVDSSMALVQAYEFGQQVEYFSATHKAWVSARVQGASDIDVVGQNLMPLYDCIRTNDRSPTEYVTLQRLRTSLEKGEPCDMYSKKYRKWLPGVVMERSPADVSSGSRQATLGYSLKLEDVKRPEKQPMEIPAVPPVLVRRRFPEGSVVQVYTSQCLGWVDAVVLGGGSTGGIGHDSQRGKVSSTEEGNHERLEDERWTTVSLRVRSPEARGFLVAALDHRGDDVVPVCQRSSQDSDVLAVPSYLLRRGRRCVAKEAPGEALAPSLLDYIGGAMAMFSLGSNEVSEPKEEAVTPSSILETPTHTSNQPGSTQATTELYCL